MGWSLLTLLIGLVLRERLMSERGFRLLAIGVSENGLIAFGKPAMLRCLRCYPALGYSKRHVHASGFQ